jgi:hypothetical protein
VWLKATGLGTAFEVGLHQLRFYAWGDAVVAHPFSSMLVVGASYLGGA